MNILALDTSMGACSAALLCANGDAPRLYARHVEMQRGHAEALMPMVAELLSQGGLGASDLDRIATTVGPGSFTGVRIAIAAARGLALVTHATLFGTDSLTVMARAVRLEAAPGEDFAVAVDARRGMVYLGVFDETGHKLEGPVLLTPDDAVTMRPGIGLAAGSGAPLLAEAAAERGQSVTPILTTLQPSAASLAEIALEDGAASEIVRPLYLRPPDAKPQVQAVGRR